MSASNYQDLAAHVNHDIIVVIYGGNANAAVECATCRTVLLDFDRIPDSSRAADHAALLALAQRHRLTDHDLRERVLDTAADTGAEINRQGLSTQLWYLLDRIGSQATREKIEAVARGRRRR